MNKMNIDKFLSSIEHGFGTVYKAVTKAECPFCSNEIEIAWVFKIEPAHIVPMVVKVEFQCKHCGAIVLCAGSNTNQGTAVITKMRG